jgi:hypothetical protein
VDQERQRTHISEGLLQFSGSLDSGFARDILQNHSQLSMLSTIPAYSITSVQRSVSSIRSDDLSISGREPPMVSGRIPSGNGFMQFLGLPLQLVLSRKPTASGPGTDTQIAGVSGLGVEEGTEGAGSDVSFPYQDPRILSARSQEGMVDKGPFPKRREEFAPSGSVPLRRMVEPRSQEFRAPQINISTAPSRTPGAGIALQKSAITSSASGSDVTRIKAFTWRERIEKPTVPALDEPSKELHGKKAFRLTQTEAPTALLSSSVLRKSAPSPGTQADRFFRRHSDTPHVRIHSDASANLIATKLNAEALTIGQDVFFASGKLDLSSPRGVALLGHELTHVRQQASSPDIGGMGMVQRKALEDEALANERTILSSFSAEPQSSISPRSGTSLIARKAENPANGSMELTHINVPQIHRTVLQKVPDVLMAETGRDTEASEPSELPESAFTEPSIPDLDINRIAEQVYDIIEMRLRKEKERRGYF